MRYTNKFNLPKAFVEMASVERHNKPGCLSATTLLKGNAEIILSDRHHEEIVDDVINNVWAIFGTATHSIFERAKDDTFKEEFFSCPVVVGSGENDTVNITGRIDSYDMEKEQIYDWKTCSVWKIIKNDFDDWEKQGTIYAWLLAKNGLNVKKVVFYGLMKDHSKAKAMTEQDYPPHPVHVHEVVITQEMLDDIDIFITEKVKSYVNELPLDDDSLPRCNDLQRWADPNTWAVKKGNNKRAVRVFEDEALAKQMLENVDSSHFIEFRQGQSKKCPHYCACKDFCVHWQNEKIELEKGGRK